MVRQRSTQAGVDAPLGLPAGTATLAPDDVVEGDDSGDRVDGSGADGNGADGDDGAGGAGRPDRAAGTESAGGVDRAGSAFAVVWVAYALFWVLPGEVAFVGPLRSNGTPLRLLGLVSLVLVTLGFLAADRRRPPRPAAILVLAFVGFAFVALATGNLAPLTADESAKLDRYVLIVLSGAGLALLTMATVHTLDRAHVLLGWLAAGAVLCVAVGGLQFAEVLDKWTDVLATPLTTTVVSAMGVVGRLGFNRVPGTTSSPLEYSAVLAILLPVIIHLAVHARTRGGRVMAGLAVAAMLAGLPLGFSRSGLVTLVVSLLAVAYFLPRMQRWGLLLAALGAVLAAAVLVPRLVDAFHTLVAGAEQDNSITGRLGDYPAAFQQFGEHPVFGAGPGYERELASVLDNQWLGTLVRDGLVGVLGLALLLLGGAALAARTAGRYPIGSAGRSLNGALCAGLLGTAVAAGTFDLLSFQQATFAPFLLLGLVGVEAVRQGGAGPATRAPAVDGREP